MKYTVDKIENGIAELQSQEGEPMYVSIHSLPEGTRESCILLYENGEYTLLSEETERVLEQNQKRLNKLFTR